MNKIFFSLLVLGLFTVIPSYGHAQDKSLVLTSEQKTILKEVEDKSSKELTLDQIDKFTIDQGEKMVLEYLKKHNLNYEIGSEDYINFLSSLAFEKPDTGVKKDPSFDIMDAYGSVYLNEFDYAQSIDPELDSFQLNQSIKNKTIKEIRLQNEKENEEFETEVEKLSTLANSTKATVAATFNRSKAKSYMKKHWKSYNPNYRKFKNDCTNYASQVVQAGGMKQQGSSASPGHHSSTTKWYYKKLPNNAHTYSTSWSVVKDFYKYWAGYKGHSHKMFKGHKDPASYTKTGDIIILRDQKTGHWKHAVIDNGRTKAGYVAYSGHTNNHLKKSLYNVDGKKYDFYCIKF
ncbi:amidase domain-containing protein [Virgibacillus sp. 179-BFC.A HS]|uniref:Amidase domain-containing protein n=1 Tax=Tigheibacillus jepli TaxID=3035914 RepID=A0ABU5CCY0_9BACI|nr:amidase domain-containing protein [Virgibacillus sp. 179-BFC.A HS]MDY0404194.1 amidase domain-containing protein [Virgibacillus sp. 179-BFC.A HS]